MPTALARLKKVTKSFAGLNLLVIGDIMLDEYFWGDVNRISPEAPVPVVEVDSITTRLGGAANVAKNLASLGVSPSLVALCGNDEFGVRLRSMCDEMDISTQGLLVSSHRPTTVKTRVLARNQQVVRIDREKTQPLCSEECDMLLEYVTSILPEMNGVIISDYSKGVVSLPFISRILTKCHERKLFVAIDPKIRHFELYKGVSLITPNLKEAFACLGMPYHHCSMDEVQQIGWKILENLELSHLLITLSERGMALFENEGRKYHHQPTVAQKVFDVTGAGDTVISAFTAAFCAGASPLDAALFANHAAGLVVAELGTASTTVEAVLNSLLGK